MPIVFVSYYDDGRPGGAAFLLNQASAEQSLPGGHVMEVQGDTLPDLSTLWVVGGVLVERDQVNDQTGLDGIAALEAEEAKDEATTALAATDQPLIRALEDLIEALIAKGVITAEDLPSTVSDKLKTRKDLRAALNA
jgi:hypothetical protein